MLDSTQSIPATYDTIKSIMKYSSITKRRQMAKRIPAVRNLDKILPYKFDEIELHSSHFSLRSGDFKMEWPLYRHRELEFIRMGFIQNINASTVMDKETAFGKLCEKFIKNGTKTRDLKITNFSEDFDSEDSEDPSFGTANLKRLSLKAERLFLTGTLKDLNNLEPLIQNIPYKEFQMWACPEIGNVVQSSLLQSFQKLRVKHNYDVQDVDDWVVDNRLQELEIFHYNFPETRIQQLLATWLNSPRPLGTSFAFTVKSFTNVMDIFDLVARLHQNSVPSRLPNIKTGLRNCVTIPMNEQVELVVFGEARSGDRVQFKNILKVKVMKTGTTVPK